MASRGIIISDPEPTHGNVSVVINDDPNYPEIIKNSVLEYRPKPDDTPLFKDDYVEFKITSPTECTITKQILARGIVREVYNDGNGKLMVTVAIPNNFNVERLSDLDFNNPSGIPLRELDFVEFTKLTAEMKCDIIRKIDSYGDIARIPDRDNTGSITVRKAEGLAPGTGLNFNLPNPVPSPFNLSDIVEFKVTGEKLCEYVQLIEPHV